MARLAFALLPLALCLAFCKPARAQQPCASPLDVQPASIPIDLWYGGSRVRVTATVPHGAGLALVLQGPRGQVALRRKGKVGGVLWMNVGDVELRDVPSAYLLATTGPVDGLGTPEARRQQEVGYEAIGAGVRGDVDVFPELIKLKEEEGVFSVQQGALRVTPGTAGADTVSYDMPISARVPEGTYDVRLVAFEGSQARCVGAGSVSLTQTGAAKALRTLAMDHGLLYGIAAVVIAIVAGLATGLVFGGGSKGH